MSQRPEKIRGTSGQMSKEFDDMDTGERRHQEKLEQQRRQRIKRNQRRKRRLRRIKMAAAAVIFVILIGCIFLMISFMQGNRNNTKGLKLYENGEYEQAAELFEEALKKDETNSEYLINLGMTYIALGDYDEALASFESAIANTNRSSLLELAKRGCGIVYLSSGHYSKAVELFSEALICADGSYGDLEVDILYYLAEAMLDNGDAAGAVGCYTTIIELQEDANAYMLRGLAWQSSGDNESAEEDLKTALEMNKKNYKLYIALYEVLAAQDEIEEAVSVLNEALNLNVKSGEDYSNRGIVYMYLEDYESAAEAFAAALEKSYYGAYLGLAESLTRQGEYEAAALQYENYLAEDTTNASAYNQYGLCLMELGRYEDALTAFELGLALNDRLVDKELMFNEAVAYEYLADWDTAYEKMLAFTEKYPDDTDGQQELIFLESRQ